MRPFEQPNSVNECYKDMGGVNNPYARFRIRSYLLVKKLYVGNLAWATTDEDLQNAFSEYGSVASAVVITERDSGRSRGFGFVEMEDGADAAIEALNGQDMQGRAIRVNEAKSKEGGDRGGRGGRSF